MTGEVRTDVLRGEISGTHVVGDTRCEVKDDDLRVWGTVVTNWAISRKSCCRGRTHLGRVVLGDGSAITPFRISARQSVSEYRRRKRV